MGLKTARTIDDGEQRLASPRSIEKHQRIDSIIPRSQHSAVVGSPAHNWYLVMAGECCIQYGLRRRMDVAVCIEVLGNTRFGSLWD